MIKGFTTQKVLIKRDGGEAYKVCKPYHWTWHEDDMIYYRDDVDDTWFSDVPVNGQKSYTLKADYRARLLVKIDK